MKKSILKTFSSWRPKGNKPEAGKSSIMIPETPKTIDYKSWWNNYNGD